MKKRKFIRFYVKLAEGPGVARRKKILRKTKKFFKKYLDFLAYNTPAHECPQKIQPCNIYIYTYTNVLFYQDYVKFKTFVLL